MNEQTIFLEALEIELTAERQAFLDQACGNNAAIRHKVEMLLKAHGKAGDFLQKPPVGIGSPETVEQHVAERMGDSIGPYKLLQQIGEGGMGVVYMAEQTEPIERRVALKIIKPGMDTRQVIARFEAERQALAMMDHPNIAKVLDADVTESNRPYFVMELVKGRPITEYCDTHKLGPRKRLELFLHVCQAIQHAHQKGIIHRDIKPSNVLVADYDDQPAPKVIDFGVAKAVEHRLTEKTVFTEFGQVLGTFEYMSPEQAKLNQWDVDTRTDIYSLGVLLYELLAGETPFDRQQLRSAAFDELLRIIREEDPPKPSTRASTSESLETIAENRTTEPAKLGTVIRGELDWIVMKALDKDRTRRYDTANSLAADIERHLNDEPVVAGPPLARYRLAKFVKRNKLQVIAAAAVAAAFVVALVGTSVGMVWTLQEQARADDEAKRATAAAKAELEAKERAQKNELLAQKNELRAQENEQRALKQKEIAERELARATEIRQLITEMLQSVDPFEAQGADTTLLRGILDDTSQRLADGEIADELVAAELHSVVSRVYQGLALWEQAELHASTAMEIFNRLAGSEHVSTLRSTVDLGSVYIRQRRLAEAESLFEKTLKTTTRLLGPEHETTQWTMHNLALTYFEEGRLDEAEPLFDRSLEIASRTLDEEHELTVNAMQKVALVYMFQGRHDEAEPLFKKALEIQMRVLGPKHPTTQFTMAKLAENYHEQGQFEKAEKLMLQAIDKRNLVYGPTHAHALLLLKQLADMTSVRARLSGEAKDWDRSAIAWVRLIEQSEDNHDWFSPLKETCRTIAAWPVVFERVAQLRPQENSLWIGRGQYHALRSRWEQAASDYARGFESRSLTDESVFEYASTLLLTGDQQGYQRVSAELAASLGKSHDSWSAFVVARTCGLGPTTDEPTKQIVERALWRLQEGREPWVLHVVGLNQYRARQYEEAIETLEKSIAGDWGWPHNKGAEDALNWILLAMCHFQLGKEEKAQEYFDKAITLITTVTPEGDEASPLPVPDWIEWHVLHREAEQLLKMKAVNSDQPNPLDSS